MGKTVNLYHVYLGSGRIVVDNFYVTASSVSKAVEKAQNFIEAEEHEISKVEYVGELREA